MDRVRMVAFSSVAFQFILKDREQKFPLPRQRMHTCFSNAGVLSLHFQRRAQRPTKCIKAMQRYVCPDTRRE